MDIKYFQHGDVLLFKAMNIDTTKMTKKKLKAGIVQEGEHTGHAHRLSMPDQVEEFMDEEKGLRVIRLLQPMTITHEEHNPIDLAEGDYIVKIVREYDHFEELIRKVQD